MRLVRIFCAAAVLTAGSRLAAEQTDTLADVLNRLQAAEQRIAELEEQAAAAPVPSLTGSQPVKGASWTREATGDAAEELPAGRLAEQWAEKWEENSRVLDGLKKDIRESVQSGSSATKTMKISGRIHADYWGFPDSSAGINQIETGSPVITPQDRLGFRRLRFGVGGDVSPNMGYRIEMEFAGGDETQFRDSYISMKDVAWLQTVVVGNHKRPYGLDHLNSSRHNVFLERPFVIEAFNQDSRRLGISSQGYSDDLAWNWRFGVFNQRLIQDEGQYISDHLQGEIAGRLANTWWYDERSGGRGYAHWALAMTWAHPDGSVGGDPAPGLFGRRRSGSEARFRTRPEARSSQRWLDTGFIGQASWYQMIAVEKVVNVGPLQIVGEYQNLFLQRDGLSDLYFHGGYVYASWFLTGEHMPWNRKNGTLDRVKPFENFFMVRQCDGQTGTGWGAWQVAARYSYADFNDQLVQGGIGHAATLGLNWLWNANTRLQLNYILGNISRRNVGGNLLGGRYEVFGARFMIDF